MSVDSAPIKELDFDDLADLTGHLVVRYLGTTHVTTDYAENAVKTAITLVDNDGHTVPFEDHSGTRDEQEQKQRDIRAGNILNALSFEEVARLTAAKKLPKEKVFIDGEVVERDVFTPREIHLKLMGGAGDVVSDIKTMFKIYHGERASHFLRKPVRFADVDMHLPANRELLTRERRSLQVFETRLEMDLVSH